MCQNRLPCRAKCFALIDLLDLLVPPSSRRFSATWEEEGESSETDLEEYSGVDVIDLPFIVIVPSCISYNLCGFLSDHLISRFHYRSTLAY